MAQYLCLKTFLKWKSAKKSESNNIFMETGLNHFIQWTFNFQHFKLLEIIAIKSDKWIEKHI